MDKIWVFYDLGHAFESRLRILFNFQNPDIFYDLIQISRLPTVARPILSPYKGYYKWFLYGLEKKIH